MCGLAERCNISLNDLARRLTGLKNTARFDFDRVILESVSLINSCAFVDSQSILILSLDGFFVSWNLASNELKVESIPAKESRCKYSFCKMYDKILIYGGCSIDGAGIYDELLIFDISEKSWINFELDYSPEPRYRHNACIFHDFMIIYGGVGNKGWLRDMHAFDLNSLTWMQIKTCGFIPNPYISYKIYPIDRNLYLFGVFKKHSKLSNELLKINIKDMIGSFKNIEISEFSVRKVLGISSIRSSIIITALGTSGLSVLAFNTTLGYFTYAIYDSQLSCIQHPNQIHYSAYIYRGELYAISLNHDY